MANFDTKVLDGYVLNSADGYSFTTKWIDVKNAFAYSWSCNLSGAGTATGTLSVQTSNESDLGSPSGGLQGTSPSAVLGPQPYNNGLDANTLPGTNVIIISNGVTTIDVGYPGHRWSRLVFTGTSASNADLANVWFNAKW